MKRVDELAALTGLDGPRPLPPALRKRVEEAIISGSIFTTAVSDQERHQHSDRVADLPTDTNGGKPGWRSLSIISMASVAAGLLLVSAATAVIAERRTGKDNVVSTPAKMPLAATPVGRDPGTSALPVAASQGPTPSPLQPSPTLNIPPVAPPSPGGGSAVAPPAPVGRTYPAASQAVLSSLDPQEGPIGGGTLVTIHGQHLDGTSTVMFGGSPASQVRVVSPSEVTAVSPPQRGPQAARIQVYDERNQGSNGAISFTYRAAPYVSNVSPSIGTSSGGGWVTVSGENFSGASSIHFGQTTAPNFIVDNMGSLRVQVPAGSPGVVDVVVVSAGGTSAVGPNDRYTYT